MGWKREANHLLARVAGLKVVRTGPERPRPNRRANPKRVFQLDYDEQAKETMKAVRRRTYTSYEKLFGLISAVRYVVRHGIPGDIVECGVWRGGSMQAAARTLLEIGAADRHLYLFDTYEGMPAPTEEDRRWDGRRAATMLAESDPKTAVWAVATLEDVQAGMEEVGYPAELVHYVKGRVEETVPREAPEQISILRLDTDWYQSTRHELQHLYPRLSPGGVLILDDYGWWEGARKAVDEFLDETGERLLLNRLDRGRIAVKP
jgi:O-methyltransferase